MTETKNDIQQNSTLQQEQMKMIRASLLQHVFEKYHILVNELKKLPFHQHVPGMQHAYLQIDSAMLWVKELLTTVPLMLAANPQKKEEPVPSENQSTEENEKQPEDLKPESEQRDEIPQ